MMMGLGKALLDLCTPYVLVFLISIGVVRGVLGGAHWICFPLHHDGLSGPTFHRHFLPWTPFVGYSSLCRAGGGNLRGQYLGHRARRPWNARLRSYGH